MAGIVSEALAQSQGGAAGATPPTSLPPFDLGHRTIPESPSVSLQTADRLRNRIDELNPLLASQMEYDPNQGVMIPARVTLSDQLRSGPSPRVYGPPFSNIRDPRSAAFAHFRGSEEIGHQRRPDKQTREP